MSKSKYATVLGILIAVGAIFVDPVTTPMLATLLGEHTAAKLAAVGALLAALGRSLIAAPAVPPSE